MARFSGTELPNNKRIEVGLTYLYGIGPSLSKKILTGAGVNLDKRVKDITETEFAAIRAKIVEYGVPTEGELRRIVSQNIRRLIETGSYRGTRHKSGLPARGQRTRSNARTRKGKKKTVGGMKKKLAKK
jgi:small subunit ribosomal protein S13